MFILQLQKLLSQNLGFAIIGSTTCAHVVVLLCVFLCGRRPVISVYTRAPASLTPLPFVFSLNTATKPNQSTSLCTTQPAKTSTPLKKTAPRAPNKKQASKQLPKKPAPAIKKISTVPKAPPAKKTPTPPVSTKKPMPIAPKKLVQDSAPATKKPATPVVAQAIEQKKVVPEPVAKKIIETEIPKETTSTATIPMLPAPMQQAQSFALQSGGSAQAQEAQAFDSLYTKVCAAIGENWHMPTGIQPQSACKLLVTLTSDGKTKAITLDKSSGVVLYDLAAQAAARRATYPKEVWGKDLVLLFN